jgi:hypothetical protein
MADEILKPARLVLLAVLALAACRENRPNVGEIAVKAARGFTVPRLVLESDRWFASDSEAFTLKESGSPTVLQRAPGSYTLWVERNNGERMAACSFQVQRDRVIEITLRMVSREVRCDGIQ